MNMESKKGSEFSGMGKWDAERMINKKFICRYDRSNTVMAHGSQHELEMHQKHQSCVISSLIAILQRLYEVQKVININPLIGQQHRQVLSPRLKWCLPNDHPSS